MTYKIDVACDETSGDGSLGNWTIDFNKVPGCAGPSCVISDFGLLKPFLEAGYKEGVHQVVGGTWNCTAAASLSSHPLDEAVLSVE